MRTRTLVDQRADVLNQIDDILNTAQAEGRSLTSAENREHDQLVRRADELHARIGSTVPAPRVINRFEGSPTRSLDAMLNATAPRVAAGTATDNGFVANGRGAINPVESIVMQIDGADVAAPRINELPRDTHEAVRQFQATVADMCLVGLLVDKQAKSSADGFEVARGLHQFSDRWKHVLNALDVDTSGEGAAWVPTGIGASMHEQVRASGKIAPLFARINLPSNPWKWPIEGADATAYRVAEPTSDTATKVGASTPGTLGATFDAEIFGARTIWSRSVDADSAVAILPFVRAKLVQAFVDAEEMAILDGDADGTHQDADVDALGATDPRTAWDGLRKKALAQTTANGASGVLTSTLIKTLRAGMGKWGLNPDHLALIVGIEQYYDLMGDTNLITVDKYGPAATILNGQLGSVWGIPVIVSEHVRQDLNASAVEDGITSTQSYALLVNHREWAIGQRMAIDVEVDDSIYREAFQRVAVAFSRQDLQHVGSAAANDDTGIIYDLD
jgi:HK97 family phage major capsid protein